MTTEQLGSDRIYIAVIGSSSADFGTTVGAEELQLAEQIGAALAEAGAVIVCGGLGGVMEAVCKGAKSTGETGEGAGATTLGILPGGDRSAANEYVDIAVPTNLGEARNAIVVSTADAVIAVGGEFGTLSEIALALRAGKPVIGLGTWELVKKGRHVDGVVEAVDSENAVALALSLARR
jgi:hypothetical protein